MTRAVTLTTESVGRPETAAGRKTLPGMAAKVVLDVMTAAMTVFSRLVLKGLDWMTRTGRRLAGLLPRASPRSAQQMLPLVVTNRLKLVSQDEAPVRWVAGADAVQTVGNKGRDLIALADAYRDLSSSLAHDDD
jgi:hypothetical protein